MTGARRQRLLLALLAVAAAIFAVTRLPSLLTGPGAGGGPRLGGGSALGEARVAELEVARLEAEPRDYAPGRDPFRYYDPPRPATPPPPPPPPVEAVVADEAPPPDLGPPLPEIELTYLGSFGPAGRPIAVLTNGDTIYNAVEGDVVQGQFVVAHIGFESVDLAYVDFPDEPPARLAVGG